MPLHLLGKKSWNVYNPANIERVRRDEAEAKRREEEQEARQRDHESDDRLRFLRGETSVREDPEPHPSASSYRRKRKLPGEDDTDRDIRLAKKQPNATKDIDKLVDAKGNFSLIPEPGPSYKKARVDEDPYTVYLSHAAGKGKNSGEKPWYSSTPGLGAPARDSWGNDSPRRQEREAARVAANDPLAAMKKGVKQLREAEKHRKEWRDQRERDLREVEDLARQKRRRDKDERRDRRKKDDPQKDDDPDSFDDFHLDSGYTKGRDRGDKDDNSPRHSHRHRHHHRHRHRHDVDHDNDCDARDRHKRNRRSVSSQIEPVRDRQRR
ncbi:hypothetical protein PV08_11315 [Exophiala spinifera]|uniref:CBF1-interacting co-repressor CIR N-terminal domain-containing protein n=1 Tax=Exophiala spinifera TaxID=91928 RepID=A0A0D2AUE3_9EURO|nr:uncharacterized protein PV08_11315 [Exophiala spinifera]KIW10353.1 hypothetical protein PV08_11315 [Exophiala spinifera]